jgi:hypothetical protein
MDIGETNLQILAQWSRVEFTIYHWRQLSTIAGEGSTILPFFCNTTKVVQNEAPLLHYFIHELIAQKQALFKHASSRFRDRNQPSSKLLTQPLMEILRSIAKDEQVGKIILLIDGLEECDSEYALNILRALDWMFKDGGVDSVRKLDHIQIMISCREEKCIETWCPNRLHIRITEDDVAPDI